MEHIQFKSPLSWWEPHKKLAQMAFSRMVYISPKLLLTNCMGTYAPPTSMFPMVELDLLIVFSSAFCSAGLTSLQVNLEHRGNKVLTSLLAFPSLSFPPLSLLVDHGASLSVHGEVPLSEKRGELLGYGQVCLVGQLLQARRESDCVYVCMCKGCVVCDGVLVWKGFRSCIKQQRCYELRKEKERRRAEGGRGREEGEGGD